MSSQAMRLTRPSVVFRHIKHAQSAVNAGILEFQKVLNDKSHLEKYDERDAFRPWPNCTNPHTGEIGGPSGPEPTRFGDWERKGRVSDF